MRILPVNLSNSIPTKGKYKENHSATTPIKNANSDNNGKKYYLDYQDYIGMTKRTIVTLTPIDEKEDNQAPVVKNVENNITEEYAKKSDENILKSIKELSKHEITQENAQSLTDKAINFIKEKRLATISKGSVSICEHYQDTKKTLFVFRQDMKLEAKV